MECIRSITEIFAKEPYLVMRAYESGYDFNELIMAVKDCDPEMAHSGIEFWYQFIMTDTVVFKKDFTKNLFSQ